MRLARDHCGAASEARRMLRPPEPSEEQIHRTVVLHLGHFAVPGVFWFHVPNGEARGAGIGGKLRGLGTKKGVPDIALIWQSRFYGLELKRPGGRVSDAQAAAMKEIEAAGGTVAVAYGVDEALETLRKWGLMR